MPVLSLPLTFNNSFWSQDYRKGLETIHAKLVQGAEENSEVVAFIRARAVLERNLAASLINPALTGPKGAGFGRDDGASLLVAFRGLQAESVKQGEIHRNIARELDDIVADPFEEWADQHATRISESKKNLIDGWLRLYEEGIGEVSKLKNSYLTKTRRADEAEDDAKFAPNNDIRETYTTSPRNPRRTGSVSDRISQQLFGLKPASETETNATEIQSKPESEIFSDSETERDVPVKRLDKGKGKEVDLPQSPPPFRRPLVLSTSPPKPPPKSTAPVVILGGLAFPGLALPNLMMRAKSELPLRPIRFPILGEYEDTFTGEDFVSWLKNNVQGFGGSLDRAEDAARELTERDGLLRRIGELGNKFENHPAAIYQFRQKAFEPPEEPIISPVKDEFTLSPTVASPAAANLLKRSNTVASYLAKTLGSSQPNEPPYVKARIAADAANDRYRSSVRSLDRQRLALEDRIEATLKLWNRWEQDRLRSVKTVLLQYQGTLANLPTAYGPSLERSSTLITSFQPDNDILAAIERYRTGPFRPAPQIYKSLGTEQTDVMFGIDLRGWAGEGGWHAVRAGTAEKDDIPYLVKGLLAGLKAAYEKLPNNVERRKSWIYEVPLPAQHQLREVLNILSRDQPIPSDTLVKYDAPVIASTLKLWLLELDPPLALWEGWDDIRKLYPSVGADYTKPQNIIEDLRLALGRWPKVHLLVLDAIVSHLKELIDGTMEGTESTEVYTNKVALSVGRCILRPKAESQLSIQDRHPTVLFIDLLNHYTEIIPPTIAHKKRDSGRIVPTRKRTAPVDMRLHRSSLSGNVDVHKLLEAQMELQHPRSRPTSPTPVERTPRPVSGTFSDLPPRPQFKEPEPEHEDNVALGLPSASVIVIPPSPKSKQVASSPIELDPEDKTPIAAAISTPPPQEPAPAPEVSLPEVSEDVTTPRAEHPPQDEPPTTASSRASTTSPSPPPSIRTVTSTTTTQSVKTTPPSSVVGRVSPPKDTGRTASPIRGSTFHRTSPSLSSPLSPSGSLNTSTPDGGARMVRTPRIVRGPRVANAAAALNRHSIAGSPTGAPGASAGASTSPPRRDSQSQSPSPTEGLAPKKRSLPKRGHLAIRSMASGSEDETVGKLD